MIGIIKSYEVLKGCGVIGTLTGDEIPVKTINVNMSGVVVLKKNDIVEYEVGTDDNGKEQAVNVSLVHRPEYAVKLSKLKFKDFALDVKNNSVNLAFDSIESRFVTASKSKLVTSHEISNNKKIGEKEHEWIKRNTYSSDC